jgi:flagellar hook assembly protein FlgD
VKLYIKDRTDKIIRTIVNERLPKGVHQIKWDLRNREGVTIFPDIYRSFIQIDGIVKHGDIWIQ